MLLHVDVTFDPAYRTGRFEAENTLRDSLPIDQLGREVKHQRCFELARMTHAARFGFLERLDQIRYQVPISQRVHGQAELDEEFLSQHFQARAIAAVAVQQHDPAKAMMM